MNVDKYSSNSNSSDSYLRLSNSCEKCSECSSRGAPFPMIWCVCSWHEYWAVGFWFFVTIILWNFRDNFLLLHFSNTRNRSIISAVMPNGTSSLALTVTTLTSWLDFKWQLTTVLVALRMKSGLVSVDVVSVAVVLVGVERVMKLPLIGNWTLARASDDW